MQSVATSGCGRIAIRALAHRGRPSRAVKQGAHLITKQNWYRAAATTPAGGALGASSRRLRDAIISQESVAQISAEADAAMDEAKTLERLSSELRGDGGPIDVTLLGQVLESKPERRSISVPTPLGPKGDAPVRSLLMNLPNTEDISTFMAKQRETQPQIEKPEDAANFLEKYLSEKFIGKRSDHIALLAAWGPKAVKDAEGEFAEVAALMLQSLKAYKAGLQSAKEDFQFEVQRVGRGKICLVMPPSNFALLGLKDAFHMLLQGFSVLLIVQPRFFPQFREVQLDMTACGLPDGMLEVLPGITPDADPAVLHEVLSQVDRLQFTGSSAMFKSLVSKAYELGNLRLEHAGEISGMNKVRVEGVSVSHPAVAAGTAWAAMANNGELCTSASAVEFDTSVGDTAEVVKAALEKHSFKLGKDPEDVSNDVLLKEGKTSQLEVKTSLAEGELREWWEKSVFAVPTGMSPNFKTNQSLGHCVYAPTIATALELGIREDASCIYCVGVPEDKSAPSARAGTTGCKIPESVFGGMKTYTFAVGGDHDGVGSIQTMLNTVKRRGPNWRDREEAYAMYELTETAEMLTEFLNPRDQNTFPKQVSDVLEVFAAFEPEVSQPYNGQSLVGAPGRSQLVTLSALRPTRKSLLIPRGVGLPEEVVKLAVLCEMSPLKEVPVDLHILGAAQNGKLRVTDPLKSFLRVVEKRLRWKVHHHSDTTALAGVLNSADYPPYFYCIKDKHVLPPEVLLAVAEKGGYFYEGFPSDALTLFRWLSTTQAWTISCTEGQVSEATSALQKAWKEVGLREEPHGTPEIVKPTSRDADVGGGFGATGLDPEDDKDWAELDDDDSSSEDEETSSKSKEASGSTGAKKLEETAKDTADKTPPAAAAAAA